MVNLRMGEKHVKTKCIKAYRMPLESREFRDLDEKPLAGSVLEARLNNAQLHRTCKSIDEKISVIGTTRTTGVNQDFGQFGGSPGTVLSVGTFTEVDYARPNNEAPAKVAKAVLGGIEWERRDVVGVNRVADEASRCVSVETDHEEECEMMRIPKGLEALVADLVVGSGVHEKHDE